MTYEAINADLDAEVLIKDTKGNEVTFFIETLINRRLRDTLEPKTVFVILNAFINHKGPEFRDELFRKNIEGKNVVMTYLTKDTDIVPYKIVHDVLDMFDINEVKDFIKQTGLVLAPNSLPDEYNKDIELDERGSREQTYLKEDYYDLIALITILKATVGLVGEYASVRDTVLSKTVYKEFILLNFYRSHPIFKTPPFVKLLSSITKLVERLFKDSENTAIRIIEQNISKENLPLHILALVVIQKLILNDELSDNETKHTVTKIYSYASDKLKLKDNANSKYRIKYFSEDESDGSESESVLEGYRKNSDITPGHIEEFKSVTEDVYALARFVNLKANDKVITDVRNHLEELKEKLPIHQCAVIASWVFKGIIDMRSLEHLNIEHVINIICIGSLWALENGHEQIALILGCYANDTNGTRVNFSLRNKIKPELKEQLSILFPYEKIAVINGKQSTINFVEDTINNISKQLMGNYLISALPGYIIEQVNGNGLRSIVVPENIRSLLAEYVCSIEEAYLARLKERAEFMKQFEMDKVM